MADLDLFPSVVDDDGTFTVGTPFGEDYNDAVKAAIEDNISSTNNPSVKTKTIIDEVIAARGTALTLAERLNVLTNSDGTFLNGVVQRLTTDLTSNQSVNAALTSLTLYTLGAGVLAANGQALRITAFGITGANANVKVIRFVFGATSIIFGSTTGSAVHWRMVVEVYRVDGTNQLVNGQLSINGGASESVISGNPQPTETLSGSVILGVKGQGVVTGDVVQKALLVEILN